MGEVFRWGDIKHSWLVRNGGQALIPERPDWQRIIFQLCGSGMKMHEIAKSVGVEPATLHYIKNCGRHRIMWSTGVGLYNLWLKRVGNGLE